MKPYKDPHIVAIPGADQDGLRQVGELPPDSSRSPDCGRHQPAGARSGHRGTGDGAARGKAAKALLVIEVSGSCSLRRDRVVQAALCRAGIPEYWIVNLDERHVQVHCDADAEAGRDRCS